MFFFRKKRKKLFLLFIYPVCSVSGVWLIKLLRCWWETSREYNIGRIPPFIGFQSAIWVPLTSDLKTPGVFLREAFWDCIDCVCVHKCACVCECVDAFAMKSSSLCKKTKQQKQQNVKSPVVLLPLWRLFTKCLVSIWNEFCQFSVIVIIFCVFVFYF